MKKIGIIIIVIISFLSTACSDDFLKLEPYARVDENAFYTSLEAADQMVAGAYAQPLASMDIMDTRYMMSMGSIASDDAETGGTGVESMPDAFEMDRMAINVDNIMCARIWGHVYKGIDRCNVAILKFPEIEKLLTSDTEKQILSVRTGEIKFLRGFYYFVLAQVYGSVPLITIPLNPDEYSQTNVPMKKIFEQVEKDLLDAINLLPEKEATDSGRATKGAAKSLLAKLYLYESSYRLNYGDDAPNNRFEGMTERWDEVIKYGEDVIASGRYKLVGIDGEKYNTFWSEATGGFRYLFSVEGDNCDEVIFTINYFDDKRGWGDSRGNTLNRHATIGTIRYKGEEIAYGWNYLNPTKELIKEFENGDVRLNVTAALPGDTLYAKVGNNWVWAEMAVDKTITGSACRKYEIGPYNPTDFQQGPQNLNLIRYADLILMTAEAYIQTNNFQRATELINMVRTRARNSGITGLPANIEVPISKEEAMKALRHERRVELALEGHRFFDLVRWRLAEKELKDEMSLNLSTGFECEFQSPRNDFYPIPSQEIVLSKNALKQNPGY
jgi:starch-binding outer membrane protein, SusD/RagB family